MPASTHTNGFAILAPVPEEHLVYGVTVCLHEGKVAFGSRAWEVFRKADEERQGLPVRVLIYPSHPISTHHRGPKVAWEALYIGQVAAKNGAHPHGMKFRPPSTGKYLTDNYGHWALFWEVTELTSLPPSEMISIRDLRGLDKKGYYGRTFVPEGPLLIEYPD